LKFVIVSVIQRAHKCLSKMSIRNFFFQVSSINAEQYKVQSSCRMPNAAIRAAIFVLLHTATRGGERCF
jgi:hypothetical protein